MYGISCDGNYYIYQCLCLTQGNSSPNSIIFPCNICLPICNIFHYIGIISQSLEDNPN